MTTIQWKGQDNWKKIDEKFVKEEIPEVETWTRKHLKFLTSEEAKIAFKDFFWGKTLGKKSTSYYHKDMAVSALATLYRYQQHD
jgi:hypothetical protein